MIDAPADSPFLPGTNIQIAWDSTSLGLIKTCPRLYQLTMIEGWAPKGESIHLRFGGEFHQALWDYDQSVAAGLPHDEAVHDSVKELLFRTADFKDEPDTRAGKYKNRESLVRTTVNYLDHRKDDTLTTVKLSNGKPAVELSFRFELPFGPDMLIPNEDGEMVPANHNYLLCGHLDRVCSDPNGTIFIEDHKTTTTTPGDYYFAQYEPNNQMSLYTFAGGVVFDLPIKGVVINAVQLLIEHPYNRFIRGFTFRNRDQQEEWVADLSRWLQMAQWFAENDTWPQNDTACDKFGGCRFRNVCSKSPAVRDIYLKSDFIKLEEKDRWNPLASR